MNLSWYDDNRISIDESIGIDEVGRGPLAGPVVAASVWICRESAIALENSGLKVCDSKKMTHIQRQKVVDWIKSQSESENDNNVRYSIASSSVEEIDSMNILNATLLAMKRSHDDLLSLSSSLSPLSSSSSFVAMKKVTVKYALIDGNRAPDLGEATKTITIIKGDAKVLSISLASIVAKEYRDNLMRKLALEYPYYGWETNVGYGSKKHMDAIFEHGITKHHRKTFIPAQLPIDFGT